jgi:hypothetical protein
VFAKTTAKVFAKMLASIRKNVERMGNSRKCGRFFELSQKYKFLRMKFNENFFRVSRKWKKAYLFQPDKHRDCRLLIKTEVNGDSKRTNERGPSLVGLLGSSCRYMRLLFSIGSSGKPSSQIFFSSLYTISIYVSPSTNNLGRGKSCRAACL